MFKKLILKPSKLNFVIVKNVSQIAPNFLKQGSILLSISSNLKIPDLIGALD